MPYCPACGTAIERGDRFCYNCGTGLDAGGQGGARSSGPGQRPAARQEGWDHPARARNRGWNGRQARAGQPAQSGQPAMAGQPTRADQPVGADQPAHSQHGGHQPAGTAGQGRDTQAGQRAQWGGQQNAGQRAKWGGKHHAGQSAQWGGQQHASNQQAAEQWQGSRPTDSEGMLGFALSFPSRSGWEPVVLGGVGLLFGILLVPLCFVVGYFLRLAGRAAADEYYPPTFDDEEGLFRDGFVYSLALSAFLVAWFGGATLAWEVTWWLGLAVGILGSYLLPAYFVTAAVRGPVPALGARETLVDLLTAKEYVVGYLLSVVVVGGVGSVVVVLILFASLFASLLGLFIWPVVLFYWLGIQAALWGRVYHEVDPEADDGAPAVAAEEGGTDARAADALSDAPATDATGPLESEQGEEAGGTTAGSARPRHEGWTDPE